MAESGGPVIKSLRILPLLAGVLALISRGFAHQLDEYLQATLVTIEPDTVRFQINLTPGVAVAEQVLAMIGGAGDGVLATNEVEAYGERLKRDLIARLDDRRLELKRLAFDCPPAAELRTGWGIIQMEFSASIYPLSSGSHRLRFENRHMPAVSIYIFNVAPPKSSLVQISRQKRNHNQSLGEIEFTFDPSGRPGASVGMIALLLGLVFVILWTSRKLKRRSFNDQSFSPTVPDIESHRS
jgi:hypothetical protein